MAVGSRQAGERTWNAHFDRLARLVARNGPGVAEGAPDEIEVDRAARALVAAAIGTYVVLFTYWTWRNHDGFGTQAFDLGLYDQGVWLLSQLKRPFVTLMGRHLFGDHTSFILLPLALVYRIYPSAKVLLVTQSTALGVAALPLFLIARQKLRNERLAAYLAVAFLLHPALGFLNLEQFHPDVYVVPLFLFAVWFMLKHRWTPFFICVGALLLVKEDVTTLTFALGVYVAIRHDRRVGLVVSGVSALYFATAFWWILPSLNGVGTLNTWRLPFGGVGGIITTAIAHPGRLISYLLSGNRPWYVWQLFTPVAFLSLLAPEVLLLAAFPLASNLLSNFYYQQDIHYHYTAAVLPVLALSAVYGIARMRSEVLRRALVHTVLGAALVTAYLWGPTPLGRHEFVPPDPNYPTIPYLHHAISLIPQRAALSAFYGYVPHVDHRERIYMFPVPFKAAYWGTFKQEGQRLPEADDVEYVLVPSSLDPEPKAVFDKIRPYFDALYDKGGVTLLKRKPGPAGVEP